MIDINLYNQIKRFIIVGIFATAIHYGIYIALNYIMISWVAYSIGYGISFYVISTSQAYLHSNRKLR